MTQDKIQALEAQLARALAPLQSQEQMIADARDAQLKEIEEDRFDQARADALEAERLELDERQEELIARYQAEIRRLENEQTTGSGSTDPLNHHHRLEKTAEENKRYRLPGKRQSRAQRFAFEGGDASDCLRFGHDELDLLKDIEFDSRYRTAFAGGKAKLPVFDMDGNPVMIPVGVRSVGAYLYEYDERGRLKMPRHPVARALVEQHFAPDANGVLRQKPQFPEGSKGVGQLHALPKPEVDALIINCGFRPREDGRANVDFSGTKWHTRFYNHKSTRFEECDFSECKQEHDIYGGTGGSLLGVDCTFSRTMGNVFYNSNRPGPYGQYLGGDNYPTSEYMRFALMGSDIVDCGLGAWSGYAITGFDIGSRDHEGLFLIDDCTMVSAWEFERGKTNERFPIGSNRTWMPKRSAGMFMLNPYFNVGEAMDGQCPVNLAVIRGSLLDVTQCHHDVGHIRSAELVVVEDMSFAFRDLHSRPNISIDSQFAPGSSKAGEGIVGSGRVIVRGNKNEGVQGAVNIWHPDSSLTSIPYNTEDEIEIDCRTKQVLYQGKRRGDYAGMLR